MNKSETPTNKESELKKLLEEKRDKRVALEQKANEINSDGICPCCNRRVEVKS